MEISYKEVNGYLLSELEYKSGEQMKQIGKYGMLRRTYLQEHKRVKYQNMLLMDTIGEHLLEVDRRANKMEETILKGLEISDPLSDKAVDQMKRVQSANRHREISDISRSTFYYVLKTLIDPDKHSELKESIKQIFDEHKERYGYRRITLELRNRGVLVNHKMVLKLMNEMGLYCKIRRKKYNSYKGDSSITAPNIINRDFHAEK
ncbi:TnpV protein [Terrisporobacter sp.]